MSHLLTLVHKYLYPIIITSVNLPTIVITSVNLPTIAWLQILRRNYVIITLLLGLNFIVATPAMAANLSEDLLKQPATEIRVSLGNSANELKPGAEAEWVFCPGNLALMAYVVQYRDIRKQV